MDSRNRSSSAFLPGLVCAIGVAACVVGVRDIVSGEAVLFFGESGAESVSKLTGTRAYWWGGLCACWGISMIGLALVAPRAMEARTKRSSYCNSPAVADNYVDWMSLHVYDREYWTGGVVH